MIILSLDLSTSTGFARYASGVIDHGTASFKSRPPTKTRSAEHEGAPFDKFDRFLAQMCTMSTPSLIVYERPGRFASAGAAHMLVGLRGVLFAYAARKGIPLKHVNPMTLKKWATGTGHAKKPQMIAAAVRMSGGEKFSSDDAADAYLMLRYQLAALIDGPSCTPEMLPFRMDLDSPRSAPAQPQQA